MSKKTQRYILIMGLALACALLTACLVATVSPAATPTPQAALAPEAPAPMEPIAADDIPVVPLPIVPPEHQETVRLPDVTPFLTLEEFPALDGSTANLPLMAAVMSCATGIPYEKAQELVDCTTTVYAYHRLLNGEADLLLVYEGAQTVMQELTQSAIGYEMHPIGRDALVFIGNESNPVHALTQEQLRRIYTGKIKNWSKLGGANKAIIPFQRPQASGSQALFLKLLMRNTRPMEAPLTLTPEKMEGLIDEIASYHNDGGAIGYSVFYYANYMYQQPGLKFFAVDGVMPNDETIASGEYPLQHSFYMILRADCGADSPTRKLADWLLSEEGRSVIAAAGYIPN